MTQAFRLLLATTSEGKLRELRDLLGDLPITLLTPRDVGLSLTVEETGRTYEENALLKARAYRDAAELPTLAEDSGLEIAALGGAPGIYSARYQGLPDGPVKNAYVLSQLANVPWSARTARYVCVMVLMLDERTVTCRGVVTGVIASEPAGTGGFGFDPIFYVPRYRRTMAQLPPEVKNRISHRARAARCVRRALLDQLRVLPLPAEVRYT
ncbi:MAG TPA: RdgB/HAM1 family non-canonical purine NTP pyrophosphatase [Chloroflexota bacterium]